MSAMEVAKAFRPEEGRFPLLAPSLDQDFQSGSSQDSEGAYSSDDIGEFANDDVHYEFKAGYFVSLDLTQPT